MKLTLRKSVLFIIASIVIGLIGTFPMIINRNDSLLTPCAIISSLLLLIGIVGIVRASLRKR